MRLRSMTAGAAVLLATAFGVPTAASAASGNSIPWQPFTSAGWTDAPGAVCTFGVTAAIVRQNEQFRTLESYPNGDPELQEFRGPLFIQYTNMSTGASVVRDLSGYSWFSFGTDGSIEVSVPKPAHFGLSVHVGNAGFAAGEWVLSGKFGVAVSSTGEISVQLIQATAENLCQTLS